MAQNPTETQETMSAAEAVAEQTTIRRALLAGGYVPLANTSKMCVLKGWPSLAVDAAQIDEWADLYRYKATGVRVDGPLVVLDFDIDDADMLDAIWDALPDDLADLLDQAPMRFGGGDKFALFLRRAAGDGGSFGRMVSQAYAPVGDERLMRVEVFDAGAPRQFGVYGPHSFDEDGGVAAWYRWADGRGLADVALTGLPEITVAQIESVLDVASRAMLDGGWEYEVSTHAGVVDGRPRFDIEDDCVFETRDHGEVVGVAALEALCEVDGPGVRLSASWLEGSSAVNTSRCIARLNAADERLQIWESAGCVLHRPAVLDVHSRITDLGDRLKAVGVSAGTGSGEASGGKSRLDLLLEAVPEDSRFFGGASVDEGGGEDDEEEARREQIIAETLGRYGFWSDGRGYVVDSLGGPENAMTFSSFQTKMAPKHWFEKPAKGPSKKINPADIWKDHPDRVEVHGFRFLPDCQDRVAVRGDNVYINIWERPEHWDNPMADGGAVSAFQTFLEHLIPDEAERGWFTMWLAAKTQKPWLPNCGVIMVAERQGTGRGTLFDMLRGVFGARHVNNVAAVQLIGGGSQAQYTDWIERALLVTCDEVLAGDDAGGAMAWKRREVYERLKALIDPRPRPMNIVRKGMPSNEADVFASFLLATNNANALPLSADDRRIAVVSNTATPLAEVGDVMRVLAPWRHETLGFSEAFSAGLFAWLREQAVDWNAVREAPRWMRGREEMLSANETDLDEVLENVLRRIEGDFVLGHHLRERLGRSIEANGLDGEIKGWWNKAMDILARPNRLGWRRLPGRHRFAPPKEQSGMTVTSVFYRCEGPGADAWLQTDPVDRPTLWRGGDPSARAAGESLAQRMVEKGLKTV